MTEPRESAGVTDAAPRAVIVDDVPLLRVGVRAVLEPMGIAIAGESGTGRDVPRLVAETGAALLVVGSVADVPTVELVRRVRDHAPECCVVGLLPRTRRDELSSLLGLDVDALVVRGIPADELSLSVERAMKGERVVSPLLLTALVGAVSPPAEVAEPDPEEPVLTAREREVLALLAEGRSNREIASTLYVTLATVKTHLAHIYAKLGARNRNEALGRAVSLGLLT